jgi:predicted nucleic acid-binding Zn ribbon protein
MSNRERGGMSEWLLRSERKRARKFLGRFLNAFALFIFILVLVHLHTDH